jgi:hypothetical protein
VQAHHLQVEQEEFVEIVKERFGVMDERRRESGNR